MQEELECGYGKPLIGTVIRSGARVHLQDTKILSGKLVAKGEVLLHIAYRPADHEDGVLEIMKYNLPISQILDCEGADEESLCDIRVFVTSWNITPKADATGEYRNFSFEGQLRAVVTAHSQQEIAVAVDCFSTEFESKAQIQRVPVTHLHQLLAESLLHKFSLDLPEEIDAVLDMWCESTDTQWKREEAGLHISSRMTIALFARTREGEIAYFEQSTMVEHRLPAPAEEDLQNIRFAPAAEVLALDYTLTGHAQLDVRAEVLLQGCVYHVLWQQAIGDIQLEETAVKVQRQESLLLYFAGAGESVWEIAKEYNTAPEQIRAENELESDVLTGKRVLLIPGGRGR